MVCVRTSVRRSHCREQRLKACDVSAVCGIGRKMTAHLVGMNIKTALQIFQADPWMLRNNFGMVIEKTT